MTEGMNYSKLGRAVVKQLTKKLGGVPLELNEKIDKASEENVDAIAENIFEVQSVEDVIELLK